MGQKLGEMGSILHRDDNQNGIADNIDGSLPPHLRYNETFTQQVVNKIVLDMVTGVVVLAINPSGVANALMDKMLEELNQLASIYIENMEVYGVLGAHPSFAIIEYMHVNGRTLAGQLTNTVQQCRDGDNDACVALGAGVGEILIGAVSAGATVVGTRTAVVASRLPDVNDPNIETTSPNLIGGFRPFPSGGYLTSHTRRPWIEPEGNGRRSSFDVADWEHENATADALRNLGYRVHQNPGVRPDNIRAVSYTHLTLPTTPYV